MRISIDGGFTDQETEREEVVLLEYEDFYSSVKRLVDILQAVDACLGDILPELEDVTGAKFEKWTNGLSEISVTCVSPEAIKGNMGFTFTIPPFTTGYGEILFRGMGLVRKNGKRIYPYKRKLADVDSSLLKSAVFFLVDEWFMKNWKR